jgi:hypothetical protein
VLQSSTATGRNKLRVNGVQAGTISRVSSESTPGTQKGTSAVPQSSKRSQRTLGILKELENTVNEEIKDRGHHDSASIHPSALQGCSQELKEWAETLSRDNVALASEVMQLRVMLAAEKENGFALGDRVDRLQVRAFRLFQPIPSCNQYHHATTRPFASLLNSKVV